MTLGLWWTLANSLAIVVVGFALFLTIRQMGLVLSRVGPGGAKGLDQGPRIGEDLTSSLNGLGERIFKPGVPGVYIFGSRTCPICSVVKQASEVVARHWSPKARVVMVMDGATAGEAKGGPEGASLLNATHPELRTKLNIRSVPYAVVVDHQGIALGHGLVNHESHVESLLELLEPPKKKNSPAPAAGAKS